MLRRRADGQACLDEAVSQARDRTCKGRLALGDDNTALPVKVEIWLLNFRERDKDLNLLHCSMDDGRP